MKTAKYAVSDLAPELHPLYTLDVSLGKRSAQLTMRIFSTELTTKRMTRVTTLLKKHLPSIFFSTCYNDGNLPFLEEVKQTELGHLYEHILLEYISLAKSQQGALEGDYYGETSWDWNEESPGTFHITINVGTNDASILGQAIESSNALFNQLLESQEYLSN